jgi:hypothetical protein
MAFKLTKDQLHQFQATAGVAAVISVQGAGTVLQSANYNGTDVPVDASGSATFTPIVGKYYLTVVALPPVPPVAWSVVEVDGTNTQILENESSTRQLTNLIIVGS